MFTKLLTEQLQRILETGSTLEQQRLGTCVFLPQKNEIRFSHTHKDRKSILEKYKDEKDLGLANVFLESQGKDYMLSFFEIQNFDLERLTNSIDTIGWEIEIFGIDRCITTNKFLLGEFRNVFFPCPSPVKSMPFSSDSTTKNPNRFNKFLQQEFG